MSDKTFLGIPIEGDITSARQMKNQRPQEELGPIIQEALNHPGIEAIKWEQYTPYFNDGDPCEFGVRGEVRVKIAGTDDDAGEYGDGFVYGYDTEFAEAFGGSKWFNEDGKWKSVEIEGNDPTFLPKYEALSDIASGEFDAALLGLFGDHAEVTVRKDKIEVDFYSHD